MKQEKRLLIIDDSTSNVDLLYHLFQNSYQVHVASDGRSALQLLNQIEPDIILLDMVLPDVSGLDLFKKIKQKESCNTVPILVVSGVQEPKMLQAIKSLPTEGFFSKPINGDKLKEEVKRILEKNQRESTATKEETLQTIVQGDLLDSYYHLADMVEFSRNGHRSGLSLKLARMTLLLGKQLSMDEFDMGLLALGLPLRDVGMLQIPTEIVHKNGSLEYGEWKHVQSHTRFGWKFFCKSENPILRSASQLALNHHEHWDGNGYPQKLRKEKIPMEGRIAGLLDTMISLISPRPYRDAHSWEESLKIIHKNSGTQFDPLLVNKFLEVQQRLKSVMNDSVNQDREDFSRQEILKIRI